MPGGRGGGGSSAPAALLFVCGLAIFSLYYAVFLKGRPTFWPDTYEYAQVARNLVEGRGLTADSTTVMESWIFRDRTFATPAPYFFHDVGQAILLALFFRVFGVSDGTIGWMSGAFFALLVPLAYLLGLRVFGTRRTALMGAALVALNGQLMAYSATGLTEIPFAFFLTLLLYVLYGPRRRWGLALGGVVYGSLIVLRSNSLPFLPLIALFLLLDPAETSGGGAGALPSSRGSLVARLRGGTARLVPFLVGLCLVVGPNAVRNYRTLGHPFGTVVTSHMLLLHTSAIEGKSKEVFSQPALSAEPIEFFVQHPSEMTGKIQKQLWDALEMLLNGGLPGGRNWSDVILLFLFVLALLAPPPDESRRQRLLRRLVVGFILTTLVVGAVVHLRWRYLYGFFPVILLYDAELLSRILGRSRDLGLASGERGSAWSAAGVVLLLGALGAGRVWVEVASPAALDARERDNYYRAVGEFVRANTRKGAVILARNADQGELRALGWYGRRRLVEFADSSLAILTSKPSPGALFLLSTSGHGEDRPTDVEMAGFTPVSAWHAGSGDHASLCRWEPRTGRGF